MSDIFKLGKQYTRKEIHAIVGGQLDYFMPSNGRMVVCCCFNPTKDPQAPEKLFLGNKATRQKHGEWFASQTHFIPFFQKVRTNKHKYIGNYRVKGKPIRDRKIIKGENSHKDPDVKMLLHTESEVEALRRESEANRASTPKQADILQRIRVEQAAIEAVRAHFNEWTVEPVEREYLGWDLTVTKGEEHLRLEVKGLFGGRLNVGLTPNEYEKMKEFHDTYRVCIVINALENTRALHIFTYDPCTVTLRSDLGITLSVEKKTGARVFE